jgi:hypothetical protein
MKRNNPNSLVSKWKQAFSGGGKKPSEAKTPPKQEGASLALIKNAPVSFKLSRLDNPKDFELMCFVCRAVAKTADNPYRTVLHVEQTRTGSRLVACDGLRMHVAEISKKIKSGDYKAYVTKDAVMLGEPLTGINFPKWLKGIPENTVKRGVINLEKSGIGRDRNETEKLSIALNAFAKQTGEAVNIRHLEDLTKREWVVYSQNEKHKAVVLKQKNGRAREPDEKSPVAVILPINLQKAA